MLTLVYAKCGLTNWYHDQVIRNNAINLDSQVVDALVGENVSGGVTRSTLLHAAALAGGMNAQASGFATIAGGGGWQDSKGLMYMRFIQDADNPVYQSYLNVIGYIHGNNDQGLSENAIFVPQFSWETQERVVGGLMDGLGEVKRTIANRVDYLLSDGSGHGGMVTLRPADILDHTANHAIRDQVAQRIEEEGLTGQAPQMVVAGSDISRIGVVPSRRGNLNPSSYAGEILDACVGYQTRMRGYQGAEHGSEMGVSDGMYGELSTAGHILKNREPRLQRDLFFGAMAEHMGQSANRGFSGYTIGDLDICFPNFNDVLDLTLYSKEQFEVTNYTEYAHGMGTSMITEFVSHEITMNILDLMIRHDLSTISFRGSNCDNLGGDGDLANVVLVPYNGFSLKDDDYQLGNKMQLFTEDLSNQIFVKLNGVGINNLTPIRIDVTAELFGTCTINVTLVDGTNISDTFQMGEGGQVIGMETRAFPTFAINNASSLLGTSESALIAGSNYMTNIQQYFS